MGFFCVYHRCGFVNGWRDNHVLSFYAIIYCRYKELTDEPLKHTLHSSASVLSSRSFSMIIIQSQSYVTTDGQSASLSWNKAPIWGLRPDLYYCLTVTGFLMWGALSDERTGLSFARVTVRSKSVCTIYILHVIKRMYIYIYVCM
jgi:hypothetical protein